MGQAATARGRSCQTKKPLWLTPGKRHIRLIGKLAFFASMKPKVIDFPLSRKRPQLFQDIALLFQDRILTLKRKAPAKAV